MRLGTIACVALLTFAAGPAAQQKSEEVVKWTAKTGAATLEPGATVTITVSAEIANGWHMYALTQPDGGVPPLDIAIARGRPFTLDSLRIDAPLPEVTKGAGGEPDTFHYDDNVTFSLPVAAGKSVKPGKHTVSIDVTYQVCSGSICLRPATTTLPVTLTVRSVR
jgi:thiol:disulfide interchange protein DsbD